MSDQNVVYRGARFEVAELALTGRDGGTVQRQVVRPNDAVVILPMLDRDTVILIRNRRFAVDQTLWELPAGTLEAGEDPQATAERELIEESGYRAGQMERLTAFFPTPGFCTERLTAYRATRLTEVGQSLDETEEIEVHRLKWPKVLDMIRQGEIQDAKTIATVLFHDRFGRER